MLDLKKQNVFEDLLNKITKHVADQFTMSEQEILSRMQSNDYVYARNVIAKIAIEQFGVPRVTLGAYFKRDHSTVTSNYHSFNLRLDTYSNFDNVYRSLEKIILEGISEGELDAQRLSD